MRQPELVEEQERIVKEYVVGRKYHMSWAKSRGYVWILKSWDDRGNCVMETPKTHKTMLGRLSDLRETNKQICINRNKKG